MKKLLMLILCLGITFAVGACGLSESGTSSNGQMESSESIDNSETSSENSSEDIIDGSSEESAEDSSSESFDDSVEDSSNDSSEESAENSSGDSSENSSSATPPIIDGDNEMPLVPIG